jgi:hypothetical protein
MKKKTIAIVYTYPDHQCAPDLLFWLLVNGIKRPNIYFTRRFGRDQPTAFNSGISLARTLTADEFLFCEKDIRPGPATNVLLKKSPYQVTCAAYRTECNTDWSNPKQFHTGLWRVSYEILHKLPLPFFHWPVTQDGAAFTSCMCQSAVDRMIKNNINYGWQGIAEHAPKNNDKLNDIRRCARADEQ